MTRVTLRWIDVDISSVGYWGEGWSPYMPPVENQEGSN